MTTERYIIKSGSRYMSNVSVKYIDLHNRKVAPGKFNPVFSNDRCEAYRFVQLVDAQQYATVHLNAEQGPYRVEVDYDAPV